MSDFLRQWIGYILVIAGLARAVALVAHEPVMGYGNQYDMHRTSACIGLFPAKESATPPAATPEAPIALYRLGARSGSCYLSTEVAIAATTVAAARALGADMATFKLNWIGYAKLALLFGTALLIAWLLRDHPGAALVNGLVVLLVLSDPVVTLWFNTLYTEFATLWALYAAIGAACVLALSERQAFMAWVLLIVALVALAFSREQFALLAPALVLAAWPWLWHRSNRMTIATFSVAVLACIVCIVALPRPDGERQASRAETYLGALVPAASTPQRGLAIVGLPERCAPLVGAAGYRQRAEEIAKTCPEVAALSSVTFLRFVSEEPHALVRALARALPKAKSVSPSYLGTLEGGAGTALHELPAWAFSPLEVIASHLPVTAFAMLTLATFVMAPLALLALGVMRRWRGDPLTPVLLVILLGATAIYAFLTAVLGDGFSEAARHYLPGALVTYAAGVAIVAGLPFLVARWREAPREAFLEIAIGAVAIAAAGYACYAALEWWQSQPPAGVVHPAAPPKAP